jgi:hypothetical protein
MSGGAFKRKCIKENAVQCRAYLLDVEKKLQKTPSNTVLCKR